MHFSSVSDFPLFSLLQYICPPVSRKLLFPPISLNILPLFRKIHLLFTYFMCISFSPYFDHHAFMHHPMHILDAPGPDYDPCEFRTFVNASGFETDKTCKLSCIFKDEMLVLVKLNYTNLKGRAGYCKRVSMKARNINFK